MPEVLLDTIRSGLVTTEESTATPYGFRVGWISWDSGFRGTGIRIRDRVIAVNGIPYEISQRNERSRYGIGGTAESEFWASAGAVDDTAATLTIWRDDRSLEVVGSVRADRIFTDGDGQRTIGPGGPRQQERDGFDYGWSRWLEDFVAMATRVLDGGWQLSAFDSRRELEIALGDRARVEFLESTYPGPFAASTASDWRALVTSLEGTKYELTEADLAYRSAAARSTEDLGGIAAAARATFLTQNPASTLESIPAIDAIRGDRAAIAGRVVELPPVAETVSEVSHAWFSVGGGGVTRVVVDQHSEPVKAALSAAYRFRETVSPELEETHRMIVRMTDQPVLVAAPEGVYAGILADLMADTIGDQVFVVVTDVSSDVKFAGEEALSAAPAIDLEDDLVPAELMDAFFTALKFNQQDVWEGLYASWSCGDTGDGTFDYRPGDPPCSPQSLSYNWVQAREVILGEVYDVRVATVGAPRALPLREGSAGTLVESVVVEVDPIGLFDGEYRGFKSVEVHRVWELQRVDGGPWRIASAQGI